MSSREARNGFKVGIHLIGTLLEMRQRMKDDPNEEAKDSWRGIRLQEISSDSPSLLFAHQTDSRARKKEGNTLYVQGKYPEAIAKYKEAIYALLSPNIELPTPIFLNEIYLMSGHADVDQRDFVDFAACVGNIAQCFGKMYDASQSTEDLLALLEWSEEIRILVECLKYSVYPTAPSWRRFYLTVVEFFTVTVKRFERLAAIYTSLGNTSLASMYSHYALDYFGVSADASNREKVNALAASVAAVYKPSSDIRHPEPESFANLEVTRPSLQIRGAWEKLEMAPGKKPVGRSSMSAWIWNGKMYVAGGMNELYQELRDMWCLTLSTMKWKKLPNMPPYKPQAGLYVSRPMRFWNGKAYLFFGTEKIFIFDCETEKWSSQPTKIRGSWPYPNDEIYAFSSAILEGKLYIFGGDDGKTRLGTDIFMELDLETFRWRHISGSTGISPDRSRPGLRVFSQMWAVPEQRRLYLCFGDANRSQAERAGHPAGYRVDHTYKDLWSYSVEAQSWMRERMRGNFPSPRAEHSAVYNPTLKRVVVFGGYNAELYSGVKFAFSFFADAFTFNPETGMWQHIITKGFPTYRAQSSLVVDPDTGITYLFAGWTNPEYFPSKAFLTRVFDDIWQLKLDMEGGCMTEEDYHIDSRAVTHGPWHQCFSCHRFEISPKRCMGSCGGKVLFCTKSCQERGWAEHKELHGCTKR